MTSIIGCLSNYMQFEKLKSNFQAWHNVMIGLRVISARAGIQPNINDPRPARYVSAELLGYA